MDETPPDETNEDDIDEEGEAAQDSGGVRTRSTIPFPYTPLRDAESVATQLAQKLPGYGSPDQLAGIMGQRPTSGTFRTKVATARIFGAVTVTRGRIELTALGKRLADPQQKERARVEAFLHVPLFKKIYDNHIGATLPDDDGLETEIVDAGVSAKQADRARQAFRRSAEQAGFFKTSRDRLIMPAVADVPPGNEQPQQKNLRETGEAAVDAEVAAWNVLMDEGLNWTGDEIKAYVNAARVQRDIRRRKRS